MKKKLLVVLLSLMAALVLAACGSGTQAETEAADDTAATEATEATEEAIEATEEATEEPAGPAVQSGTVTTNIDMTGYEAGKTVRVWVPVATDGDYQTITDDAVEAEGAKTAEMTEDEMGNKMAYIEWAADADPATRKATVSFHATREEALRPELVEEGDVPEDIASEYLGSSSMVKADDPEVVALAEEITAGKTTILDKARAVYDWIYDNMNRDNDVVGCGDGDVCRLITEDVRAGKCTDINSVFVALCRASGVPAQEMFGIRMNDADITKNQHCWCEFYLPGTGWVPADPADVLKAVLTDELDKASDEALEKKEYYWGQWDEKRVEYSHGRDLTLSPAQEAGALNDFGYPYAEIDGEAADFYKPDEFVYTVSFDQDGVDQRRVYVDAEWVKGVIDGKQAGYEDYVIGEVVYAAEAEATADGYIPGAIRVYDVDVEDAEGTKEAPYNLLSAETVEANVLAHGITKDTKVILYGEDPSGVGRVAYALLWLGVEDVKILNGGLAAWTAAGYDTESDLAKEKAADDFGTPVPAHPEFWVSMDDAKSRLTSDDNFKLVSIRSEDEWLGKTSGYSYIPKAGEPEGAVWGKGAQSAADVADFVNADGTVKELDGLQEVWADCDFTLDNHLSFYCGTGWRATVPFLVLYQEGYDDISLYDGGWYEWQMYDDNPVQVGDPSSADCEHTTVGELPDDKATTE